MWRRIGRGLIRCGENKVSEDDRRELKAGCKQRLRAERGKDKRIRV